MRGGGARTAGDELTVGRGGGFQPDGSSLVTVACDNSHTVQVWNWRKPGVGEVRPGGKVVGLAGEGPGFKERPVGVFGVKWDPFAKPGLERFCTWGKKHLKQWTMNPATKRWSAITMSFGEHGVGNVLSCEFLKPPEPSKNVRVGHAGHAGRRGHGHAGREPAAVARRQGDQEGRGARPRAEDDPAGRDGSRGAAGSGRYVSEAMASRCSRAVRMGAFDSGTQARTPWATR